MNAKDTFFQKKSTLNCKGDILDLSTPKIMGILNVTPDSFYDGGKVKSRVDAERKIEKMIEEGADIIDIGANSSRPGAVQVSEQEEWGRLQFVFEIVIKNYSEFLFSIDTCRSTIAKKAILDYGIAIINDISAGEMDGNMFDIVAELNVPYIIMHMQGTPENMQENPSYTNVTNGVIKYLAGKVEYLKRIGVNDVIIDPGFGFGKTIEHNYQLLSELEAFKFFELPLLVGLSRKSMIYKTIGTTPNEALNGTTALNTVALLKGADILRVHDVKEAKEVIRLISTINSTNS